MTTIDRTPQIAADDPVPYTVTEIGEHALAPVIKPRYRLVPAVVARPGERGLTVHVSCPDWCVTDHVKDSVTSVVDVNHQGESAVLTISPSVGERVPMEVYLSEWPGSYSETGTRLAVDIDSEIALYDRTAGLALADQLIAFAQDVRRKAMMLPDDAPATVVRSQAGEPLRRVREGGAS